MCLENVVIYVCLRLTIPLGMIEVFSYVLVQQRLVLFVEGMLLLREFISRPI